jgi:hypothetical protein
MSALTLSFPGSMRAAAPSGPSAREDRAASGQPGDDFGALLDQSGAAPAPSMEDARVDRSDSASRESAAKAGSGATASRSAAPLSGGESDWVANLWSLAAPAGSAIGDGAARSSDWSPLNAAAGGASRARRPPCVPDAETSGAASETPIVADAGAVRAEVKPVAFISSFPPIDRTVLTNRSDSDLAADGPQPGRDDDAKLATPEAGGKDEPRSAPQAVAPAVTTPLDAGAAGIAAAAGAVAAMVIPSVVKPESRGAGPPRDQDSAAALGGASVSRAALAPPLTGDKAAPALAPSTAREESPTKVFVMSQRTWLEPVRPDFVSEQQGADSPSDAATPVPAEAAAQPRSQPADAPLSANASALIPQTRAENSTFPVSGAARPTVASATAADPAPAPRAAALRRDLDVTLEPRDLGGLALRLKSVGDRLEIAFVADKADTARMIGDSSGALASQLRDAGLGLGGVAISIETKTDGAASAGADQLGHGSFGGAQAQGNGHGNGQGGGEPDAVQRRQQIFGGGRQEQRDESVGNGDGARARRDDRGLYL